ncbi:MAG: discoidin domain-containing protein, partial [Armatimonadota bacterium]|nr:discoidin domain-containing protein [Armatimonadota bacterium]
MKTPPVALFLSPLLAAITVPALAQDVGRVSPASLPLPLPAAAPMPPDQLRAHNPWNLPMTGNWRFQLTYGQIKAGVFQPSEPVSNDVTASSHQTENPPAAAFDGSNDTRWCASGPEYPQWLQADLGKTRHVSGATLLWEKNGERYGCRVEGKIQGGKWQTLADATAAPGIGDGPIALTPADVRYVRIFVTDNSAEHWASLREFQIRITENGREIVWQPPAPKLGNGNVSAAARDAFASTNFNDANWHDMSVPSNWEMAGYSLPTYDSVDNTVGLYRRTVNIPAAWAGRSVYWRFDGALDGAEVFVNGQKAGYHESGYTAFDVDLTGLVKPGRRNLF